MQIVQGNFHEITDSSLKQYLQEKEICIRDSSNNNMYGRLYNYSGFGKCEIHDRPLPIAYKEEIINKKKIVTYELL